MKYLFKLLIVSLIFCPVYMLSAQNTTPTDNGLYTSSTSTVHGTIHVNLPSKVHSGDLISGTVRFEAKGTTNRQKDKANKQLANYTIAIADNIWTTDKNPQQWDVSTDMKTKVIATIKDPKGKTVSTFPINIQPEITSVSNDRANFSSPEYFRSGYANRIIGPFDGNAANTNVMLDQQPLEILAESPQGIVCNIPEGVSGEHLVTIEDNASTYSETTSIINAELYADSYDLSQGETTQLHLEISGLENVDSVVRYQLENLTPGNVNLQGGPVQTITITQNDIETDGTYSQDYTITAIRAGGFSVSCALIPPESSENEMPEQNQNQNPGLTDSDGYDGTIPMTNAEYEISPNGVSTLINYNVANNSNINFTVLLPAGVIKEERNKARDIPPSTSLEPRDPDDKDKPYSRPVPTGLNSPKYDKGNPWPDANKLLDKAKSEVKRAQDYEGKIKSGIPGFGSHGLTTPAKTYEYTNNDGVKCREYVYYFFQRFSYVNDRTLLHEEQLSPSYEFFIAEGQSKIDVTETETGWEVGAKATVGKGPVEVEISGKYWEKTTKIKGKGSSSLKGRHLWLFHVGRLYLVRKAFLRIKYEYHYEVCDDGTTNNWVVVSYSDNWMYWYDWQEELFVASKDDEGNFHRVDAFPYTSHTEQQGGETESYEVDGLDRENFDSPINREFFPNQK